MTMRKICIVTGTRAEYGLLKGVIRGVEQSSLLELQLIVTGAHLSPDFGLTYREIESDGFRIDTRVEMLLRSDSARGIAKSMSLCLAGTAEAFAELQPDLVVLLGDRYEMLSAASAALISRVPIAHIHGGEASEGAFDEAIRHAITKMSHLHFVAAEEYRRRVVQLGENTERVFLVGGLGVDAIAQLKLLSRAELEESLGFRFGERNLLVTFHPVTLDPLSTRRQMQELLSALDDLTGTNVIFTMPNADNDGRVIMEMVNGFVQVHRHTARAYPSLGQLRYLSCLQFVNAVVGNSSSGLTEAPTFKVATINIGSRQAGRLRADSVIDCEPTRGGIATALARAQTPEFMDRLKRTVNPYGSGGASEAIVRVLEQYPLAGVLQKRFHVIRLDESDCFHGRSVQGAP
jgi:GDP/UDP-N,N'-diacetylbacillosamine 2-epimerase (hydrolysing)